VTVLSASNRLRTFVRALRTAGLAEFLSRGGPYTVLAPSDRAFSKVPERELQALLGDRARLTRLIRHHVLQGDLRAERKGAPDVATTIDGRTLSVKATTDAFLVDGARLVQSNVRASNGVVHVIDTVLMPR
jgi:uncharacterized surface protein with fasciclin (FAS1) repeats